MSMGSQVLAPGAGKLANAYELAEAQTDRGALTV
jgi:hypothetical protein